MPDSLPGWSSYRGGLTSADHRAVHAFRAVLRRHGGRQTIATDYAFAPEVVEIFASGRDEAAFVLWREPDGIAAIEFSPRETRRLAGATMDECLERVVTSLARTD